MAKPKAGRSRESRELDAQTAFLTRQYVERAQTRKDMHELQQRMLHELEKSGSDEQEHGALPKDWLEGLTGRQKERKKAQKKYGKHQRRRAQIDRQRRIERIQEWTQFLAARPGFLCVDTNTQLELGNAQFTNPVNEGVASAQHGNWLGQGGGKSAYGEVGEASLAGAYAQAWNRSVFGFVSTFTLPGPGQSNTVRIASHLHVDFTWPDGWLEALSFGRLAWGEVTVNSHVDVLVGGSSYRDGVDTLLHGVSPRGNYREGDIGIYNPTAETRDVTHELEFTATNPAGSQLTVSVFELAEFMAERHHRVDRCNAVVWGTCTWSPTDVLITTHC